MKQIYKNLNFKSKVKISLIPCLAMLLLVTFGQLTFAKSNPVKQNLLILSFEKIQTDELSNSFSNFISTKKNIVGNEKCNFKFLFCPPPPLVATATADAISCNGETTTITVSATGGTAPYDGTGTYDGIAPGTYNISVTDANGDIATTTITITEPKPISYDATIHNVTCFNGNDGTITITNISGGTSPYLYSWNTSDYIDGYAYNLFSGGYSVTLEDVNGCSLSSTYEILEPEQFYIDACLATNVSTPGGNDGTVTAGTVNNGVGTVTYSWSNGVSVVGSSAYVNGLPVGTYTLTVSDDCSGINGTIQCDVTVGQPSAAITMGACSATDVLCNGASDGSVTAGTVTNSVGAVTYSWSNGTIVVGTSASVSALPAGTYTLTVTDANGSSANCSVTISEPSSLVASSSSSPILCFGGTATVTVTASGGTPPYLGTGNFTVSAGNYSFTVTDANGCTATISGNLTEPNELAATLSGNNIDCNGNSNGLVTVSASGGTPTYSYLWNDLSSQSTITASGLAAGSYSVVVTDANGCTYTASYTLTEPDVLIASSVAGIIHCNGGTTTVDVSASGGTPPYTNTGNFTVSSGAFSYTVTDANGCTSTTNGTIADAVVITNLIDLGDFCKFYDLPWGGRITTLGIGYHNHTYTSYWGCDSFVTLKIKIVNAVAPGIVSVSACGSYTLPWGTVITSGTSYTNYNRHYYTPSGCDSLVRFKVRISNISLSVTGNNGCYNVNGNTGSVSKTVSGGIAPYSYSWSDGTNVIATTSNISGLSPGTYTVTVTDAIGCTASGSATITAPTPLVVSVTTTNVSCYGGCDGSASATVSGGVSGYTYLWKKGLNILGSTTSSIGSLCAGTYTLTVTDANGCSKTTPFTIAVTPCAGYTTYTKAGYSAVSGTASSYLSSNFSGCFTSNLVMGCTYSLTLTTAAAAKVVMAQNGTNAALTVNKTDPPSSYKNTFAGNLTALALNLGFDNCISAFSSSSNHLKGLVVLTAPFAGWTVQQVYDDACKALGGCSSTQTINNLNAALVAINANFNGGTTNNGYLACPCISSWKNDIDNNATLFSDEESSTLISVSPNPSNNIFNFSIISSSKEDVIINLYDVAGKMISSRRNQISNIISMGENISSGVYVAEVIQGTFRKSIRIVKVNE